MVDSKEGSQQGSVEGVDAVESDEGVDLSGVYDFLEQAYEESIEEGLPEGAVSTEPVSGLSDMYVLLERLYEQEDAVSAPDEVAGAPEEQGFDPDSFDSSQQQWSQGDVEAFWAAAQASGGLEGVQIPFSTEGLISWRVEPSRDDKGKVLRAAEARKSPAELIISSDEGVVEDVVIVLTPEVLVSMRSALMGLERLYADPVKPSVSFQQRKDKIIKWHLRHKFLGSFNIIFVGAILFFTVRGVFEMAF